ncbi:hypothetical protein Vau01_116980 [Virgisporangium aurantiacum]|uniref:UDP-N-acetylglucosamine kinase n=1 Tax=Virgisporangium aurantiacum TaxID=175570 RepID=A0A8J4E9X4_9ACTN|nr:hypothetical protein Vau01_116980 [Virgisporangium aurantiacum]
MTAVRQPAGSGRRRVSSEFACAMPEGELSEAEIKKRFRTHVVCNDLAPDPLALFVGGQPGAGKSTLVPELRDQGDFDGRRPVLIDPDGYRQFYPECCSGNVSHGPAAGKAIYRVLNRWVDLAIDYAASTRRNALVDGTLADCHVFERRLHRFLDARFEVQVVILAVPWVISRINVVKRYLTHYQLGGSARRVPVSYQENAFDRLLDTAAFIDRSHLVSRVSVYRLWSPTVCHRAFPTDAPESETPAAIDASRQDASVRTEVIYDDSRADAGRYLDELAGTMPDSLHRELSDELDEIDALATNFFNR